MYVCHCHKLGNASSYRQIDPIISKEDLETLFKDCGVVSCIQIRCSRGQAVNKGVAVPTAVRTERDRQYATVEFRDPKAVLNAVKKNGTILKGCQLLVCVQLKGNQLRYSSSMPRYPFRLQISLKSKISCSVSHFSGST